MTLPTFNDLSNARQAAFHALIASSNGGVVTGSPSFPVDTWRLKDSPGAAAAGIPGGEAVSDSTQGAPDLPTPADKLYLAGARIMNTNTGQPRLILVDRLVQAEGIVFNTGSTQFINSVALPRHTSGEGVWAALMATADGASSVHTGTISYTNQDGVAGRTGTVSFTPNNVINSVRRVQLESGDTGVRSVESLTWTAFGVTAANARLVLAKPLGVLSYSSASSKKSDLLGGYCDWQHVLREIPSGAALNVWVLQLSSGLLVDLEVIAT